MSTPTPATAPPAPSMTSPILWPCSMICPIDSFTPARASPKGPRAPCEFSMPSMVPNDCWAVLAAAVALEPESLNVLVSPVISPSTRTMTEGPDDTGLPPGGGAHLALLVGHRGGLGVHEPDHGREHFVLQGVYVAGLAAPVAAEGGVSVSPFGEKGSPSVTCTSTS
jgi:hypothetical protein